jgi:hypothetical protein
MNDIFSSLDFAAKLDRSKKLSVEIGNDEKNGGTGESWVSAGSVNAG